MNLRISGRKQDVEPVVVCDEVKSPFVDNVPGEALDIKVEKGSYHIRRPCTSLLVDTVEIVRI